MYSRKEGGPKSEGVGRRGVARARRDPEREAGRAVLTF